MSKRKQHKFEVFCRENDLSLDKDINNEYKNSKTFYASKAWDLAWEKSQTLVSRKLFKKLKN